MLGKMNVDCLLKLIKNIHGREKNMKRVWKVLICCAIMCCLAVTSVSAVTSPFYFNLDTYTTDMTLRTIKDGGADYERYYYITPTTIQYDKNFTVTPWHIITESNRESVGGAQTISYNSEWVTQKYAYGAGTSVPAGDYYYLFAKLSATGTQYVAGNYTP